MYGFRDCEFAHSSLYFATQGHSLINLRNVLRVWWQYEFCVETEALLCMLHCVQSIHNRTKTHDVKSLFVCNIVVHVLQIIVVWLQLIMCEFLFTWCGQTLINFFFVSADVYLVQNQTVTVQNGTNFREIYICLRDLLSCLMLCYRVNFVPICLKRQANSTSYY